MLYFLTHDRNVIEFPSSIFMCSLVRSSFKTVYSFLITQQIKSEVLFTSFLVEHNIPLSAADHAGALFKQMFPDSDIASKCSCAR